MDTFLLEATKRDMALKPNALRGSGRIPAVYYGQGRETVALQIDYQKFRKIYEKAGENTIVELTIDGKKTPVLIHEIQVDPVSDNITHADFIHVDMQKHVTTSVKVNIIGIAPAVKNLGGVLDVLKYEIKIKCLPNDLIHSLDVDVSSIVDFNTSIHIKDLVVPTTIQILDNPGDAVVTAAPPKAEEEAKPAAEAVPAEGAAAGAVPAEGAAGAAPAEGAAAPKAPKGK